MTNFVTFTRIVLHVFERVCVRCANECLRFIAIVFNVFEHDRVRFDGIGYSQDTCRIENVLTRLAALYYRMWYISCNCFDSVALPLWACFDAR